MICADSSYSQISVKGQCVQVVQALFFACSVRMAPVDTAGLLADFSSGSHSVYSTSMPEENITFHPRNLF